MKSDSSENILQSKIDEMVSDSVVSDTSDQLAIKQIEFDSIAYYPDSVFERITFGDVYIVMGMTTTENPNDPIFEIDSTSAERSVLLPKYLSIVYPNPAHDITNLKIMSDINSRVIVILLDMNGKVIRMLANEYTLSKGENNIPLDVGGLPPSQYILQIRIGEAVETKRIVIV